MGLKKVTIVGLSQSTHHEAPWRSSEEIWGLPWDEGYWPLMSRLFEMHDLRLLDSEHSKRARGYLDRLQNHVDVPLYMQRQYWPGATRYPFEAVAKSICQPYWNCSIAYALALAIHEGYEEINLYGVDMAASEEYAYQRPNMEYLVGVARGKGIIVNIPEQSSLCTFNGEGISFYDYDPIYKDRYGNLEG